VITIDVANAIFLVCLLAGGALLLVTVVLDDLLGGILDSLHVGFDLAGVSLMPLLLGFVSMFGVGGLIGTQLLQLDSGRASLVGGLAGAVGAAFVFVMFSMLRRSEAPPPFSLNDLVGQRARVSVAIPARRYGSVYLTYAGASHNLTATADTDVPNGATVTVTGVAGSHLIVAPQVPESPRERTASDSVGAQSGGGT
jgi:membrane protein implicated in regulation of membrane protease activity